MSCVYAHTKVSPIALRALTSCRMASIHSIFTHSLNLSVNGQLVHVGCLESELSCFGLTVKSDDLQRIFQTARVGDLVRIDREGLLFYCQDGPKYVGLGEQILLDLHIAKVRSEAFPTLVRLIERQHLEKKIGLCVEPQLWRALWPKNYAPQSRFKKLEAMRYLIGRGKGLTPSGDDMLLGFGVGLLLQGYGQSYLHSLDEVLYKQTTDVSLAYLTALLEESVNESYVQLARALDANNVREIHRCIINIQNFGHTSGADGLFGLLESFKANPFRRY